MLGWFVVRFFRKFVRGAAKIHVSSTCACGNVVGLWYISLGHSYRIIHRYNSMNQVLCIDFMIHVSSACGNQRWALVQRSQALFSYTRHWVLFFRFTCRAHVATNVERWYRTLRHAYDTTGIGCWFFDSRLEYMWQRWALVHESQACLLYTRYRVLIFPFTSRVHVATLGVGTEVSGITLGMGYWFFGSRLEYMWQRWALVHESQDNILIVCEVLGR